MEGVHVKNRIPLAIPLMMGLLLLPLGCGGDDRGPLDVDDQLVLQPSELCSNHPADAVATFEDSKLASNVGVQVPGDFDSTQDPLTCRLLSRLTAFRAGAWAFHVQGIVGITSIVGIQNLTNLTFLSLDENSITDISLLSGFTSLTHLNLQRNNITDIDALSGLTGLTDLRLAGQILGLGVTRPVGLQDGVCEGGHVAAPVTSPPSAPVESPALPLNGPGENRISDLNALSGLTSLTFFTAGFPTLTTDISVLSGFTSLECLGLSGDLIPDISVLSGLTSMKELWLWANSISDISALSGLTSLTTLRIDLNSISDISVLAGFTSLEELSLSSNSITDISALSGLTSLRFLDLRDNSITDIQPLLANTGLGAGDNAFLPTSVSCTDVAALEVKGVEVLYPICP